MKALGQTIAPRFRRTAAYLLAVEPHLAELQDCTTKASVFRDTLTVRGELDLAPGDLPSQVAELIWDPPPPTVKVPTPFAMGVFMALYDSLCVSEPDYETLNYEAAVAMYSRPMYRILMHSVSPERVLRTASDRWSKFHEGVALEMNESGAGHAAMTLHFPAPLYDGLLCRGWVGSFRAAAEAAGATDVDARLVGTAPTSARYDLRWQLP